MIRTRMPIRGSRRRARKPRPRREPSSPVCSFQGAMIWPSFVVVSTRNTGLRSAPVISSCFNRHQRRHGQPLTIRRWVAGLRSAPPGRRWTGAGHTKARWWFAGRFAAASATTQFRPCLAFGTLARFGPTTSGRRGTKASALKISSGSRRLAANSAFASATRARRLSSTFFASRMREPGSLPARPLSMRQSHTRHSG
jgi:hypothetical protein